MNEFEQSRNLIYRFGDVEVREAEFFITKAGQQVPVEPKVFKVLLHLLRFPGRLVSKDDLIDAVWNGNAVSDSSLTRNIALLRRLLGDDPHAPRYIATVTTVGYRFIYPVEVLEEPGGGLPVSGAQKDGKVNAESTGIPISEAFEPAAAAPQQSAAGGAASLAAAASPRWPISRWWRLAAGGMTIGVLALALWYVQRPRPPLQIASYTKLTHDGHDKQIAGTDGSRIYFTQSSPFVVSQIGVTGGVIVPVAAAAPLGLAQVWDVSPDGANLLISQRETGELAREFWSVRALGGSLHHLGAALDAAFSPDGNSVVYSTREGELRVVRSDGTGARKLAGVGGAARELRWSPDGRLILFSLTGSLWEISLDGSNLHKLLLAWRPSSFKGCGRWTADGRLFLFRSGDSPVRGNQIFVLNERRNLFRHPPAEPYQLTNGPIDWDTPIPSRDGKTIFALGRSYLGELVSLDPQSKQLQPYLKGFSAEFLSFSPNGKWLAYVTFPDGILWRADRDGSNPVQLTEAPLDPLNPQWSPDSSRILFGNLVPSSESATAYVVPAEGGSPPQRILPNEPDNQADPGWSPDGRKVVFASGKPRGQRAEHLSMLDLETGTVTLMPGSEGFRSPRWSRDGRYLLALSYTPPCLRVFDFKTGRWSGLPIEGDVNLPSFSHDGKFIYALDLVEGDRFFFRIPVTGGKIERLFDLKDVNITGRLTFSMSLDPTDAPLLLRETGSSEIYALTLAEK